MDGTSIWRENTLTKVKIVDIFIKYGIEPNLVFWWDLPNNKPLQAALQALKDHDPQDVYNFIEKDIQKEKKRQMMLFEEDMEYFRKKAKTIVEWSFFTSREHKEDFEDQQAKICLKKTMSWFKTNVLEMAKVKLSSSS